MLKSYVFKRREKIKRKKRARIEQSETFSLWEKPNSPGAQKQGELTLGQKEGEEESNPCRSLCPASWSHVREPARNTVATMILLIFSLKYKKLLQETCGTGGGKKKNARVSDCQIRAVSLCAVCLSHCAIAGACLLTGELIEGIHWGNSQRELTEGTQREPTQKLSGPGRHPLKSWVGPGVTHSKVEWVRAEPNAVAARP